MSNSETAVLIDETAVLIDELLDELFDELLLVFVPEVDNNINKSQYADKKKKRRHSKAKFTSDRTSQFVQVGNEVIDGKLTNQVIVRTHRMNIQIFIV